MADQSSVKCERTVPPVKGLKDQEITVGRHVVLDCAGTWDKIFDFNKAYVKVEETAKYSVKVVKAEARSVAGFEVDVAFYQAGEFNFPDFILTDGTNEIHLGEQKIKVETVIEKPQEGKPPEPFGAIFPVELSWPSYYLMGAIGIVALGLAIGVWLLRRQVRFLKLITKLKDYDSSISADRQFYKAIRQAEINGFPLADVEHAFRFYITRAYQIPAFDLSDRALLLFFKRRNPWFKKERVELKKILEDFKFLAKLEDPKLSEEKTILIQKLYRFIDHAEIATKQKGAR